MTATIDAAHAPRADAGSAPLAAAPDERQFLDCVHCGLCLSACPTYLELGTEADSPRGRIYLMKALIAGAVGPGGDVRRHLDLCLGCRACETACPSGVRYGELIEDSRARLAHMPGGRRRKALQQWLVHHVVPYPRRLRAALAPVRAAQRLGLWPLVRAWVPGAALLPDLQPEAPLPAEVAPHGAERQCVALFTGCVNRVLCAETNAATLRVLARNGCRVIVPEAQGCCGALHLHGGARATAEALARAAVDAFPEQVDAIIVTAAGCGAAMKEYGRLLGGDPAYAERARRFSAKVRDVTEYLAALPVDPPARALVARATYHDACHLAHAQGIRDAPRALLAAIPGLELVELDEADHCCGSAGSYNLTEPGMAHRLRERKVARLKATNARYVLAANAGCALQIAAGLRAAGVAAEVLHPVELLDRAYGGGS